MSNTTEDMQKLVANLMAANKVQTIDALFETPDGKAALAEAQTKNPSLSAIDNRVKAIRAMRFKTVNDATLQAHVIDPRAKDVTYDKKAGEWIVRGLGIVVCAEGRSKFVKVTDFDADTPIDKQFAAAGLPGDLKPSLPVTISGVSVTTDFMDMDTKVKLSKESQVQPGGHEEPFPDNALTLEYAIGQSAFNEGKGAWKRNKFGTFTGEFGSIDGDPMPVLVTIADDADNFKLDDFDDNPENHRIKVPCVDFVGNKIQAKLKPEHIEQVRGIPVGSPIEAYYQLIGDRLLGRGKGSIYFPMSTEDFGNGVFDARLAELQAGGYLKGYGNQGNVRLFLADKPLLDENGNQVGTENHVEIGGVNVYDIVQKGKDDRRRWEVQTLAAERGGFPWMSFYEKAWDNGTDSGVAGEGCFVIFLDYEGGGAAPVRDDDPLKQLLMQQTLAPQEGATPNGTQPAAAPAQSAVTLTASTE